MGFQALIEHLFFRTNLNLTGSNLKTKLDLTYKLDWVLGQTVSDLNWTGPSVRFQVNKILF